MNRRVEWCQAKLVKNNPEECNSLEEWARRVSEGSGRSRVRVCPDVPIYGEVRQFDEDEKAIMRLPPKWALFPMVKLEDVKVSKGCANAKARTIGEIEILIQKGEK